MHTTEQLNAALSGRYEIERQIGAGGMATVYLARDLKHHRNVALKVLNPELGAVVGPERFLAEIEVTANLHHPHLLPLFDSGESDGLLFYVMPYVEGETLRHRLERERQLTVDAAIRIACAVASALDYAHRHGVIHRDLKPENILLHDGEPLVMDFGIALAVSKAGGARVTQTGISLGTPQYMSPEQATGDRELDARSDIYSLGAVLYEMLTGDPPHSGSTVQAIIARVLTERPQSVRATRERVPEYVEAAVMCALAKLPADRFATAAEFSEALTGARPVVLPSGIAIASAAAPRRRRGRIVREVAAWTIAAAGIAVAFYLGVRGGSAPTLPAGRFPIELPDSVLLVAGGGHKLALSPDGSQLVMVGGQNGRQALYIRRLDDPSPQLVRGSDSASSPAFSPDGKWLLYRLGLRVMKVSAAGGTPRMLVDSVAPNAGATWGDGGRVLYVSPSGLWLTSSDGGTKRLLAKPDTTQRRRTYNWPSFLPGGQAALITVRRGGVSLDSSQLGVVDVNTGRVQELGVVGLSPRYAGGYIIFGRSGGEVYAIPFSLQRRAVTGPEVRILEGVWIGGGGAVDVAVSDNGVLAYHAGAVAGARSIVAVTREGQERPLYKNRGDFGLPRVSPDGRRIAVAIGGRNNRGGRPSDIWVLEPSAGTLTRLTTDSSSRMPVWSRDGARVFFNATNLDSSRIMSKAWDGSGAATMVWGSKRDSMTLFEVSPGPAHGFFAIVAMRARPNTTRSDDIFIAPVDSPQAIRPFLSTPSAEKAPAVSPDGKIIAYMSNESGRPEVYVRMLPGPGARVQVSTDGGSEPLWSREGSTLFYKSGGFLTSATIADRPALAVTHNETLFRVSDFSVDPNTADYDVFPGGREFVMLRKADQTGSDPAYILMNWTKLIPKQGSAASEP